MLMNHDGIVFVVSDSPDIIDQVEKVLADEPVQLICCSSPAEAPAEFDSFTAEVLLVACDSIARTEKLLTLMHQKSKRLQTAANRTLALCNKSEVSRAYELCRKRKLDNYVVFWPLSFDHTRLGMSIYQALNELAEQHNSRKQTNELSEKTEKLKQLKTVLNKQLDEGDSYTSRLEGLIGKTEQEIYGAICEIYQSLMKRLAENQTPARTMDIKQAKQEFSMVNRALQHLRSLSESFEEISAQHRALAGKLLQSSRNRSILVVEDDKFQRNVIRSMMAREDYQLMFACNADEATAQVQHNIPDLILMDVMMPGVNGIELTRQLKQNPILAHVPVVMITSHTNRDIVVECKKAGAIDFIVKPYNRETLINKVSSIWNATTSG